MANALPLRAGVFRAAERRVARSARHCDVRHEQLVTARRPVCRTAQCCATAGSAASSFPAEPHGDALHLPSIRQHISEKLAASKAYIEMARVVNVVPSLMLVFLGAWAATGRNIGVFARVPVWLMALVSCFISMASTIVNDFFDRHVDRLNAPNKPLVKGTATPEDAILVSMTMYTGVLITACFLETSALRWITASATALTILYTPLLKKMTLMKNLVVATVIAASPVTGAIAAGVPQAAVFKVAVPCMFLFLGIIFREVLMDINDRVGDRADGIRTIPVVAGPRAALAFATACLLLGTACGVFAATNTAVAAMLGEYVGLPAAKAACGACVVAAVGPLFAKVVQIWRSDVDPALVTAAIETSFKPIGLCMIVLAALAA